MSSLCSLVLLPAPPAFSDPIRSRTSAAPLRVVLGSGHSALCQPKELLRNRSPAAMTLEFKSGGQAVSWPEAHLPLSPSCHLFTSPPVPPLQPREAGEEQLELGQGFSVLVHTVIS